MNLRTKIFMLAVSLTLSFALLGTYRSSASKVSQQSQTPLIILQASQADRIEVPFASALGKPSSAEQKELLTVRDDTQSIAIVDEKHKLVGNVPLYTTAGRKAVAINRQGHIYVAGNSDLTIVGSAGERLGQFQIPTPSTSAGNSIALLEDGEIVVATSDDDALLTIFDTSGRIVRKMGAPSELDEGHPAQNRFLNSGKVVSGPSGEVFYVSTFRHTPTVQRFSADGRLLSEFRVDGAAVQAQSKHARDFLAKFSSDPVGGLFVIKSAAVDPATGHLWLGVGGQSQGGTGLLPESGTLYEYTADGQKLAEYALVVADSSGSREVLIQPDDITVNFPYVHVLTLGQIYSFNLTVHSTEAYSKETSLIDGDPGDPGDPGPCGAPGTTIDCSSSCPNGGDANCGALIGAAVPGAVVITKTCNATGTGCTESALLCVSGTNYGVSVAANCSGAQPTPTLPPVPSPTPTPIPSPTPPPEPSPTPSPSPTLVPDGGGCNDDPDCESYFCDGGTCAEWGGGDPGGGGGGGGEGGCYWDDCSCWDDSECDTFCDWDGYCAMSLEDPILIDVDGNGFAITDAANGVNFNFFGSGLPQRLPWTAPGSDDAWLVLDRNRNGAIDNGSELFGNLTPQPRPPNGVHRNGFRALAMYDMRQHGGNGDGVIDRRDAIYSHLRLWQDSNHNGISEPGELHPLTDFGIDSISLDYKESRRTDQYGNQFRYRAKVADAKHAKVGRWAWDVILGRRAQGSAKAQTAMGGLFDQNDRVSSTYRGLIQALAPRPTKPTAPLVGGQLSLPGENWAKNHQTLVIALQEGCHFCADSADFYRRLDKDAAVRKATKLVAVLPGPKSDSKAYLKEEDVSLDQIRQAALRSIDVRGTPTLLLVNDKGVVTQAWVGKLTPQRENEVISALRR